jgi:hypothetical protein
MTKNIEHYTYLFHERAGIIENDGISKEQANKTALSEIKWRYQKENNLDIKNPATYSHLTILGRELLLT